MVIVNWNSREDVLAGLRSLRAQAGSDHDVVVVDNGSRDGSVEAIRAEHPEVRVVDAGENLGFAEGCNRGIDASRSGWVLLLNNDATVEPGCMARLLEAAGSASDDVGMIQPLLVFASAPGTVNSSGLVVLRSGHVHDRDFGEPLSVVKEAGEPFCPTAGAALYRRRMLEEVRLPCGYLDRRFFMYYEDVDLGWRCRLAGYRTLFLPGARVVHRFQGSSRRRGSSFVINQCRANRISMLVHNASLRFLLGSIGYTAIDLALLVRDGGIRLLLSLFRGLPASIGDRRRVSRSIRVGRRELERTWFKLPFKPIRSVSLADRQE